MRLKRHYFRINWPNWRRLFRYWVLLGCCWGWAVLAATQPVSAQTAELVSLTVKLRHSDGTAVVGETIMLERLPEETPISPNCMTDASGGCSWTVERGLYQLLFERPLDDISSLAVAEGGLRGFGITVGDASIAYHFTFHSDGRVYFDAAPEAVVPSPIIPEGELLHGGVEATPSPKPAEGMAITATPSADDAANPDDDNKRPATGSSWRLILFIAGGLSIGGTLHLLRLRSGLRLSGQARPRQRRKTDNKPTPPNNQEAQDA